MANLEAWSRTMPLADEHGVEELFRTRYLEMVRLAGLLGADDPEDIAQEAGPAAACGSGTPAWRRISSRRPAAGS